MALAILGSFLVACWAAAEACQQLGPHAEGYEVASSVEPVAIGKVEEDAELADAKEVAENQLRFTCGVETRAWKEEEASESLRFEALRGHVES